MKGQKILKQQGFNPSESGKMYFNGGKGNTLEISIEEINGLFDASFPDNVGEKRS